jgi:hypothetical protein
MQTPETIIWSLCGNSFHISFGIESFFERKEKIIIFMVYRSIKKLEVRYRSLYTGQSVFKEYCRRA